MNHLITGVSSGLGNALANSSLKMGINVFGISRRKPMNLAEFKRLKHKSIDLSRLNTIQIAVLNLIKELLLKKPITIDLIVLNAGKLGEIGDLSTTAIKKMDELMKVNVWANKLILDTVFSSGVLVQQVVAISSGAALSGSRGWNGYAISKCALNMLIKLYAAECPGTHFSSLNPGILQTEMNNRIRRLNPDPRFEMIVKHKEAYKYSELYSPSRMAPRIFECCKLLREKESGIYHDINNIKE